MCRNARPKKNSPHPLAHLITDPGHVQKCTPEKKPPARKIEPGARGLPSRNQITRLDLRERFASFVQVYISSSSPQFLRSNKASRVKPALYLYKSLLPITDENTRAYGG